MLLSTLLTVGIWYAGSSITKGAGSPAKSFVFFKMIPEQMIAAIPTKYALGATQEAPLNRCACNQCDDRQFCAAGDKGGGHDRHLTVSVVLDRTGSHDTRDSTTGTDQHRDKGFTGKTKFTEDTVHDKCDTGHVTAGLPGRPGK